MRPIIVKMLIVGVAAILLMVKSSVAKTINIAQLDEMEVLGNQSNNADLGCLVLENGYYAHPTNCEQYIQCEAGFPIVFDCGLGNYGTKLHYVPGFGRQVAKCDYPENAGCEYNVMNFKMGRP